MYIYAEYLLLENFIINFIILYVTKHFSRTETSRLRLVIASIIGALYTLVVFFPSLKFMTTFIIKLSISILIIIIAFNPVRLRKFLTLIATFYVVSFVFAGAALALFYLSDFEVYVGNGIFYINNFPLRLLIIAIITSWILIKFSWGYIQSKLSKARVFIPITIEANHNSVDIVALLDTGNSLKDPITDIPVIIAEFSAIKNLLPKDVQNIFLKYKENSLEIISSIMEESIQEMKFRLIPFKSLGKENGMLIGFKPDRVIVNEKDAIKNVTNIIVGIYNNKLSNENDYKALLHPDLLD
ncbi:sigma-E processing peptidase SpoIIGA [Thermohalobacter berrensis]|uniref:Sporulation sigma-E factor-processing peptidase n=1 Tax=Thermohalobacter berrensis TaxID=99594 RepID=A0A419TA29_9FIRM|nr:sigma-E processing peptidase SpoIIGA [Thermohalobacter berrensis]RKD34307.1 sigma-E processing peptidase SpoIIGA [Thermohalobacter berrensis]